MSDSLLPVHFGVIVLNMQLLLKEFWEVRLHVKMEKEKGQRNNLCKQNI